MNYKYINGKPMGLPAPIIPRKGLCKRHQLGPYVHKVNINNQEYYKVHVKRQEKSKIHYFKTLEAAQRFVNILRMEIK